MFRDITLGQYYPIDSVIHRLDPRTKILGGFLYIIGLFISNNVWSFGLITIYLASVIIASKVPFLYMVRGLRGIIFLLALAGFFNLFFTPGEPVVSFGVINITVLGIRNALLMIFRMSYLIIGTSILTLTTSPGQLTAGLERSLGFLSAFGVPVHEIAMMITIALRFIPLLMEETDRLMKAQLARGADFESGGLVKKAKGLLPILVPLFVSSFRRANDLAFAMEARCYHGGNNRTKMYPLKYKSADYIACFLVFAILVGTIVLRILF